MSDLPPPTPTPSFSGGPVPAATLLAESHWLQGLGRGLVRDTEVEDLVQDTWVEAMKRPLVVRDSLRGWLKVVATRLAGKHYKSAQRRTEIPHQARRPAPEPEADVPAQWNELREHLRAALTDLHEPYRSAIRMRYYENMTPTEIAAQTSTPVATVQIRLQRGKSLLRAKMANRYGPDWRPAMAAVLLPGSFSLPAAEASRHGGLLAAGLLGCTVAAGSILWPGEEEAPIGTSEFTAAIPVEQEITPAPAASQARVGLPPRKSSAPVTRPISGRLVDARGRALANVQIGFRAEASSELQPLGRSGADGRFTLRGPLGRGRLDVTEGYVGLRLWPLRRGRTPVEGSRIVATRTATLSGYLVDENDRPVADAQLVARCGELPGFPEILDRQTFVDPIASATTDARGHFQVLGFPIDCPAELHCSKLGYRELRMPAPRPERSMRLVLTKAAPSDPTLLTGLVRDHLGQPVADALVGVADTRTRSDRQGRYRLKLAKPLAASDRLYAGKKGHLTAVVPDIQSQVEDFRGRTLRLDIDLGVPMSIAGVLTDSYGRPLPEHRVFLGDPCPLHGDLTAEGLAAGQLGPFGASGKVRPDGSFRVRGLGDRDYDLRVFDPEGAGAFAAGTHAAGTETRIQLHKERFVTRRGRLLDPAGDGIADAKIHFEAAAPQGRPAKPSVARDPITTQADGSFTLRRIPREGGRVFITGGASDRRGEPGVVPTIVQLDARALDAQPFELMVPRLCHFRVHAPDAEPGSTIEFVDAYDQPVDIFALDATGSRRFATWPLHTATTEILCTSQSARTMILRNAAGEESGRTKVFLGRGFVNEIDL